MAVLYYMLYQLIYTGGEMRGNRRKCICKGVGGMKEKAERGGYAETYLVGSGVCT